MGISKITRNFQVTIPKDIRELKKLKGGDRIIFAIEGDRVDIIKVSKNVVSEAAGLWSGLKEAGVEYERKIRKEWDKRLKRELS